MALGNVVRARGLRLLCRRARVWQQHAFDGDCVGRTRQFHKAGAALSPFSSRVSIASLGFPLHGNAKNTPLGGSGWQPRHVQPISHHQQRGLFIQTQTTPNPASLMFVPGKTVLESGVRDFPDARSAMVSPLAKKLFHVDGVKGVFFGSDFITVTKAEGSDWATIKPEVFAAIMDHFTSGQPIINDGATAAAADTAISEDDDEVVALIKELLDTRIRPAVQEDGGDILYKGFDAASGVVSLKLQGACSGCPSSMVTLKSGIENMLMHYVPEVKGVKEVDAPEAHEKVAHDEFHKLERNLQS